MSGKKLFSSGGESKLDSGEKWIGERPFYSRFSGGNALGTLDSAGVVDPKVKNALDTGVAGRDPLVEKGGNTFEKLKLEDTGRGRGRGRERSTSGDS